VSRILAHSPEGVLLAMESPSPAPAKERKPLGVFIDYLKESRKYDQTAIYLDLACACRRDKHHYNSRCSKFYWSLGLVALDSCLLGNHWRTGDLGRRKGIGPAMDETCRRELAVVWVGSDTGFVRAHYVYQFLAIDHSTAHLYPVADSWDHQSISGRMVLARVDA